ncbi:protein of unknown function [Paraburkholderia dioscoreae]|uniref:Uncharacterized protein n=1 Tax=Paraburkholderia dioscoreae TaxID=2604047 RepID=A0A5Q4Z772_9BURK|nr:protein of unknown function [Paraburkholderia dioscoreae]
MIVHGLSLPQKQVTYGCEAGLASRAVGISVTGRGALIPKIGARAGSFNALKIPTLPTLPVFGNSCLESFNVVRVQSQSYTGTCYNSGFI